VRRCGAEPVIAACHGSRLEPEAWGLGPDARILRSEA